VFWMCEYFMTSRWRMTEILCTTALCVNLLQPSGLFTYRQVFNIQKFYMVLALLSVFWHLYV
jgi:hypothetical protein